MKRCSVRGCSDEVAALGLCVRHYGRLRRGQPLDVDRVEIADPRRVALVLPGTLYERIIAKAKAKAMTASSLIREKLEKAFP